MEGDENMVCPTGEGKYSSKNTYLRSFRVMQSLYKNELLCDITLKTDDGKIVKGHKLVLASASPYFRAMFTSFVESSEECINIREMNSTALRLVIDFIYTAQILVTEDNVQILLFAASLLQVNDVKDACCHFLQTKLQPSNCFSIKALADLYDCKGLFSSSESFIQLHYPEVVTCDEFLSLSSEQVIKLISSDELVVPSEEIVFKSVIQWVNHNSDSRKDNLPKLMENVRLPLLTTDFLHEKVEEEPLIKDCLKCKNYIIEALYFQLLKVKYESPGTLIKSIRTKPRKYTGPPKVIVVVGGCEETCDMEYYDPITNLWKSVPEIFISKYAGFAILKDRYVFAVGGAITIEGVGVDRLRTVNMLDLFSSSLSWVPRPTMITTRASPGVAILDNCIYAVGGYNNTGCLSCAEVFDCSTDEWRMISTMATRRDDVGVGVLNNLLYAVGGFDGGNYLKSVECYDPITDTWTSVADMCSIRSSVGIGVLNDVLYAIGGQDEENYLSSVEVYIPSTGIWTYISDMNIPRLNPGVVTNNGLLYVVGGMYEDNNLNSVEMYNPNTDTWTMLTASMITGKRLIGAFIVDKPSSF